ncbi:MAG: DUF933 domain-containing protein [Clostridiales bacterium]|nr:DUF933 domain-containing protein [Clostridiales bacterium]
MKIGLVGLTQTGKTTFFDLLTHVVDDAGLKSKKPETHFGIAKIPDSRIDFLAGIYKPKKTTYATIEVTDIRGITASGSTGGNVSGGDGSFGGTGGFTAATSGSKSGPDPFLESVRQVDALVHVVRAFRNDQVEHIEGSINPMRDIETVNMELLFADLAVIENRIEKIKTDKKITKEKQEEMAVLEKCRDGLEKEQLISGLPFAEEERQYLKTFRFLTERPQVLLVNMDEDQLRSEQFIQKDDILKYTNSRAIPVVEVCAQAELEISLLEPEDRALFMEDLGIVESGIHKLSGAMYSLLGLISFLTTGEDEVRAWPLKKGTTAKNAGGKIHSDIERGFIRAEVVKYHDFEKLGSMHKLKEKGLFRLEGKEYVIEDGDIINFRFNV